MTDIEKICEDLKEEIMKEIDPSSINPLWVIDEILRRLKQK